MRVYVECENCGENVYVDDVRQHRKVYPAYTTIHCSSRGHEHSYHRSRLEAEPDGNATAAGVIAGGVAGALAGLLGVAVGAGLGGALGNNADQEEKRRVREFYNDQSGPR